MGFKGLKTEAPAVADAMERRDARRMNDGMRQLVDAIGLMTSLEARLRLVEDEMTAGAALDLEALPGLEALGLADLEPRLMEASYLICAMTRRLSLRLGAVERVLDGELVARDHGYDLRCLATPDDADAIDASDELDAVAAAYAEAS